jgi:thiol-disulfide isomerase/thioredoxin
MSPSREDGVGETIDFWAAWYGPCRAIALVLEEVVGESGGRATPMKLNVDVRLIVRFANDRQRERAGTLQMGSYALRQAIRW